MSIRTLIVDDQTLVRAGLSQPLRRTEDLEVMGEAGDGTEAVSMARDLKPDVVLMDIRLPDMDGIEATRRIVADPALAHTRVVMLTAFDADHPRVRVTSREGGRVPPQGRRARRVAAGRAGGGGRRRSAGTGGDQEAPRDLLRPPGSRRERRRG